ncbi:MAG TPA: T9SS type A sorting domain-containing protein [Bacteroidales bacterium]|nr:T9SS type A sorting domain-containing protein [Bacteroidales bacterium]
MKSVMCLFLLWLASSNIVAQNFTLFNASSKKTFTDDPMAGSTFSIAFDSVTNFGNDSLYFNLMGLGNEIYSDTCEFWGGPFCIQQNKPSWLGSAIIFDNISLYRFITSRSDTLIMNFDLLPGDSSLFYQDAIGKFYMVYEGSDTITTLGIVDSARFYRISNTDASGNTIHSPLNNEGIVVGKQLGLIDFFRIDSFPQILQPLSLIGNRSPDAGLFQLTNEILYDHQPGDEIQYEDRFSHEGGPPWENYHRFIKHHFIERTDTQDSIIYLVARSTFEADSTTEVLDTITLRYQRNEILAVLPFDDIDQSDRLVTKRLYKAGYCDFDLWTYSITPGYLIYCSEDNCWGPYDIPGPPPDEEKIYACGLGLYSDKSSVISPPPWGYWSDYRVIYFKKDGITCGDDLIVQVRDPFHLPVSFNTFPNPVRDKLTIHSDFSGVRMLKINNLDGKELLGMVLDEANTIIDVSKWKPGIYIVKMISSHQIAISKIIKI